MMLVLSVGMGPALRGEGPQSVPASAVAEAGSVSSSTNSEKRWLTLSSLGARSGRLIVILSAVTEPPLELMACVLWHEKQSRNETGACVKDSIAVLDMRSSPAEIEKGLAEPFFMMSSG